MKDKITNFDLINLFRNEFIIKMNQYKRLGIEINEKNAMPSILTNHSLSKVKNIFYLIKYNIASILTLVLVLLKKNIFIKNKELFLFNDLRQYKLKQENIRQLKVGLYNFRYFKHSHILSFLTKREIFSILFKALDSYKNFKNNTPDFCQEIDIDSSIFKKIINISFIRYLDILLTIKAISKYPNNYYKFRGHFDVYTSLYSLLRKKKYINFLEGYQHGLYELSRISLEYNKLYVDKYNLLFKESKNFFLLKLNANKNSIIYVNSNNTLTNLIKYDKKDKKLIVFAMQNDNYNLDKKILRKLQNIYSSSNYILLCYIHPSTSNKFYRKLIKSFENIIFERKRRFSNINILYTRYSTIGIEYHTFYKTTVFFIKTDENVCIFTDKSIKRVVL